MNATPKHVQYVYLMTIHYYPYSKTAEVDQAPHRKNPISSFECLFIGETETPFLGYSRILTDSPLKFNSSPLKHDDLEDHPMTCKWLITMAIVSPLRIGLWDPFQMAFLWLMNGGDPNHFKTGMILQVYTGVSKNKGTPKWMVYNL